MRMLVTGGAGFIGSWLCKKLVKEGHEVIVLDNFLSGLKNNIKNKKIRLIQADVTKPIKITGKIDMIFHLASLASPKFYKEMPMETMLANSLGTLNLLNMAKKFNARLVFASTSEIYGDPKEHPQKEDYYGNVNTVGERSCYDESKRFGEALVYSFCTKHKISYCIVRIFNTYGPRMRKDDGRVVPNFIGQSLKGKDITIYGDGKQTRSFCYAEDTVNGIYQAAFSRYSDVFNIGNPAEITMTQLAKKIKKLTQSKSRIVYTTIDKDDPHKRKPSIEKAKRMLEWEPKTDLETGLKMTINWFKHN